MKEEIKEPKRENESCSPPIYVELGFKEARPWHGNAKFQRVLREQLFWQLPLFWLLFMNPLLPMPSLAFLKHFSIPKVLKYTGKHIKAPSGMKLYNSYSIQG
ncbi:hypothetical protein PIB30_080414 [Stylosanthes scabra]|uniref:Uncharacterized protein n=1 Tax=Stylosanthes scabra TaxID=79078 RepID=A0ABU6VPX3_9FABA|nr:hypothetical protein [Stylosanthes scabra]